MPIKPGMTDPEILVEVGGRLRAYRLQQNLTLRDLARRAGVTHLTLLKLERGDNFTMETLVKVLRALGRLEQLDAFLPEPGLSPLALLAQQQQGPAKRRRASRTRG